MTEIINDLLICLFIEFLNIYQQKWFIASAVLFDLCLCG
jgi:hypothetical protein